MQYIDAINPTTNYEHHWIEAVICQQCLTQYDLSDFDTTPLEEELDRHITTCYDLWSRYDLRGVLPPDTILADD